MIKETAVMIRTITGIYKELFGTKHHTMERTNICMRYTPKDKLDNSTIYCLEFLRFEDKFFTSKNRETE